MFSNVIFVLTGLQEVQARAVLCPLSGRGEAIPMPYRTLSIGTGNILQSLVHLHMFTLSINSFK